MVGKGVGCILQFSLATTTARRLKCRFANWGNGFFGIFELHCPGVCEVDEVTYGQMNLSLTQQASYPHDGDQARVPASRGHTSVLLLTEVKNACNKGAGDSHSAAMVPLTLLVMPSDFNHVWVALLLHEALQECDMRSMHFKGGWLLHCL
ncbi:hypothetical protein HD554DRAFT_2036402 [Boletus coccyginus]|nr:hypothetical protein HD554DRAFT_2036402 [Boletus coccyginus]